MLFSLLLLFLLFILFLFVAGRGVALGFAACYRRDARTPARLCRQFEIFAEVSGAGANGVEIFAEVSGAGLNGVEGADEDSEWVPTA